MDFFASQDSARRKTTTLLVYFASAVVGMILVLYLAAVGGQVILSEGQEPSLWQPEVLALITSFTAIVISVGSLYKTLQLRAGGERVAQMLGGRRLQPNTDDLAERRLLNVVEEMALASGIPAPPVYVLDREQGINAFAAGFGPSDAVIGVNRGTLQFLNRDELQGVIAHEFSHILNGDMRLNLRLIGLLHGILLISLIGYYILRFSGSSNRGKNKGSAAVPIAGLVVWLIGAVGLLCARLIKAAISRQREYLADAAAVQFTRNPDGIGSALKKIGGLAAGSRVAHPEAESASHMFFALAFRTHFGGLFATHPPLAQRIQRIDPQFDGTFPRTQPLEPAAAKAPGAATAPAAEPKPSRQPRSAWGEVFPAGAGGDRFQMNPVLALQAVGTIQPQMVEYAGQLLESLPDPLRQAAREPFSARAVAFALLLDDDPEIRAAQLELVRTAEGAPTLEAVESLRPLVAQCRPEVRLPLLETMQAALRGLSAEQYQQFRQTVVALVNADQSISLFEFVLQRILLTHLDRSQVRARPPRVKYLSLTAVAEPATNLLSLIAHVGQREPAAVQQVYDAGLAAMGLKLAPLLRSRHECSTRLLDESLSKLEQSAPMVKKRVLAGLFAAAAMDQQMTVREAELLRAIADSISCPLPPLVAGAAVPTAPSAV